MDYQNIRRKTKEIKIGSVSIGASSRIAIQSMTNTDTHDKEATLRQIRSLESAGCDIVRITIPDLSAAETIPYLKQNGVKIPIVADIHFDYKVAIRCAELGVDKIRINPGNIGSDDNVRRVVEACKKNAVPIRIGVNAGSLEKHILAKYGAPTPEALTESALYHAALLEKFDFRDTVISVKASTVTDMIKANRLLAQKTDYPLHLGVTEAGGGSSAIVKSSIGIGTLLTEGIGDTVRVSLTDDPVEEIYAAKEILKAIGMAKEPGMDIVSCPTCGRTKIDLISLLSEFKDRARAEGLDRLNIKVALMGCVVNGPGEAREADLGIAGGKGEGLIFRKGEIIRKVGESQLIDELIKEIKNTYC